MNPNEIKALYAVMFADYDVMFAARGIRYESRRTANARRMSCWHDDNDGHDDPNAVSHTAQTPSLPSSPSQEASSGNKHGLCVAAGQPLAAAEAANMGPAPSPVLTEAAL